MLFENRGPSVVKSIKQRDLLNTWLRLYAKSGDAPRVEDFQPERLGDEGLQMGHYSVVRKSDAIRFIIDDDGARLAEIFGASGRGCFLDEYVGPELTASILPIYYECAGRGLPVYSIASVHDIKGRPVAYERLLLPFFDGSSVNRIIGSINTICEDGAFEVKRLMRGAGAIPIYKLLAVINRETTVQSTRSARADDIVEV